MGGRPSPPALATNGLAVVATTEAPFERGGGVEYETLKPRHAVVPGVESCLPKGMRHSSAPSRYGNAQTLGSTLCSPTTASP
uniref:Uncharacterized protein n=1 Tax=Kalanchoe fedtschenkoi TaxID=63787 RepID=A0A7N1A748_KALFE